MRVKTITIFSLIFFFGLLICYSAFSASIFTVVGTVRNADDTLAATGLEVVVSNETKKLTVTTTLSKEETGRYGVVFIDMENKTVAAEGDVLKVAVKDAQNVTGSQTYKLTADDIAKATAIIDVKLGTSVAPIASGFTPNSDGYSFPNFSDDSLFVWDIFRDTFGREQVEYGDTGRAKRIAEIFFVLHYLPYIGQQILGGGVCNGMAATSLLFFENPSTLAQFSATAKKANQLEPTHELKRHIEIYQGYQLGLLIKDWKANQGKDPATLFNIIKNSLKKSPSDQQVINIYGKYKDEVAGHSVAPYKIEEKGNNIYWVYVYDSNYPYASGKPGYVPGQENKKMVFNLDKHSWEYEFTRGVIWTGDDKNQQMNLVPLAFYHEKPILIVGLFGGVTTADYGTTQSVEGTAHLLFEDSEGRRLGYVNGELVSEIPGAIPIIPLVGAADVPYPETYYISKKVKLQPKNLETEKGIYDFSIYTTRTMFMLDDVTTTGDNVDTLEVSDSAKKSFMRKFQILM